MGRVPDERDRRKGQTEGTDGRDGRKGRTEGTDGRDGRKGQTEGTDGRDRRKGQTEGRGSMRDTIRSQRRTRATVLRAGAGLAAGGLLQAACGLPAGGSPAAREAAS